MKKILTVLLYFFYPILALADSTTSFFTPPTSDYSVIFLGNMFGIVDGVLHGSGGQIMGKMFLVFNSAVLAIGGCVITYTVIVGTMNTSHEGQFLGQKWSSIWIPVRAVTGMALLIPKASGYCLMQIFIMWIVVQGVGAADKVWDAALDYLNLGGVFVAAASTLNPSLSDATHTAVKDIATGESAIVQGQVCMRGIQTVLENARTAALKAKESGSGMCVSRITDADAEWAAFCGNTVPDFLSTVNAVEMGDLGKDAVDMPHFTDGSMYEQLNGCCGKIKWNKLDMASDTSNLDYVSAAEIDTLNQTRPIAVQQMYVDLIPTSSAIVNNDPEIKLNSNLDPNTQYSSIAQYQFGVPYLSGSETTCPGPDTNCKDWHALAGGKTQTYFLSGFEFINSLTDYNTIMMPVLNLQDQNNTSSSSNKAHDFINDAKAVGWIMSGAYFFDMVALNGTAAGGTNQIDGSSGLQMSTPYMNTDLTTPFNNSCSGSYGLLCKLLQSDIKPVTAIDNLITGASVEGGNGITANVTETNHQAIITTGSSSTNGYITNASLINLPGQPGLSTPTFKFNLNLVPGQNLLEIPHVNFACGKVPFLGCVGRLLGDVIWNTMIKQFLGIFINFITELFNFVVQELLILPLTTMMTILNNGVQLLNTSQTHPIVAMAYMGTSFINYCTSMYFSLIAFSAVFAVGGGILLVFILPFLGAWMGVMLTIGFLDAYYVPFLPYMIFIFGAVAWFLAVTEAMVAGPIVGLGITHPEGEGAMGKAEAGLMILINVFLRPSLMVIGYIAAITLSYVVVYAINAGFGHFMSFFMPKGTNNPGDYLYDAGADVIGVSTAAVDETIAGVGYAQEGAEAGVDYETGAYDETYGTGSTNTSSNQSSSWTSAATDAANAYASTPDQAASPYTNYASMYAGFFCLLVYTTIYLTVVEKCFTLIYLLPDNILRWISGGQAEQFGKDTAQWTEATKSKVDEGGKETAKAGAKVADDFAKKTVGKRLSDLQAEKPQGDVGGK